MARASRLAGRALDQLVRSTELFAPELAFRFKRHFYRPDMRFALGLLRKGGFAPTRVIDAGAYLGEWALECRGVFPDAHVLMVEPSAVRVRRLQALCARDPKLSVSQALLSSSQGFAHFCEQETNSAIVASGPGTERMATTTLDTLVADGPFAAAELLKVDVQGHDLEVLVGAPQTLKRVAVIVIELSLIQLHPAAPRFRVALDWLDDAGFRLFDVASFMRRPVDDALWQLDAVFVRHDSTLGSVAAGW